MGGGPTSTSRASRTRSSPRAPSAPSSPTSRRRPAAGRGGGTRRRARPRYSCEGAPVTVALLYCVHGNLPALEAALVDVGAVEAASYLLLGDSGMFGPWPRETVERL